MTDYIILTDSTCDLTPELATRFELSLVNLQTIIDDKTYVNYLDGRELPFKELYNLMRNKKLPTTSAVNPSAFLDTMEPILASGKDILYLGFSSSMSGTYSSGVIVANKLLDKYPDRKIFTVDTLSASLGEGLIVYLCGIKREQGASLLEVYDYALSLRLKVNHLFTIDDLFHVKRGGRLSASSALFGSFLGIKPILKVNDDGLMEPIEKAHGRKKAIHLLADQVASRISNPDNPIFIGHGDCLEDANLLRDLLLEKTNASNIMINFVGSVCGAHGGPDVLAVFFLASSR